MPRSVYKIIFSTENDTYTFFDSTPIWHMNFDTNEVFYDSFSFQGVLRIQKVGNILVELANTNMDYITSRISESVFSKVFDKTYDVDNFYNYLSESLGSLLSIGIVNKIYDLSFYNFQLEITQYEAFCNFMRSSIRVARSFCDSTNDGIHKENIVHKVEMDMRINNRIIDTRYSVSDIRTLLHFDILKCQEYKTIIKKCANCNKFFIPSSRIDEIYCDNIFTNGKTCKMIGYEIKAKRDPFKSAYRTAYKTQRARIKNNSHIKNYESEHFSPWEKAVKEVLEKYRHSNDIDGFREWLKNNRNKY